MKESRPADCRHQRHRAKQNATKRTPWRFVFACRKPDLGVAHLASGRRSPEGELAQQRLTGLRPKPEQQPKRQRLRPKHPS